MAQINKPTEHFNTKLYTGNGTAGHAITGLEFAPSFTWIKSRSATYNHHTFDVLRGVSKSVTTNESAAEITMSGITAFNSDGFTLGSNAQCNNNTSTYASFNWKANGSGTANTDGSINSTVSANNTAGFSIVSWNGSDANGTIGHGLNSAPRFILIKNRDVGEQWYVYHESIGNGNRLVLNDNTAQNSGSDWWQDTSPTNSVFYVSGVDGINGPHKMIAYCFAPIKGYSKFGSYTGAGAGAYIYTGFKPAWVMWKKTAVENWGIANSVVNTFNQVDRRLRPDADIAEQTGGAVDFLSNGFKFRSTSGEWNASGSTYIYAAFASEPLVGTNNIPCTAR